MQFVVGEQRHAAIEVFREHVEAERGARTHVGGDLVEFRLIRQPVVGRGAVFEEAAEDLIDAVFAGRRLH